MFQLLPLLSGRVSLIEGEELIKDGEDGIDDSDEDEGDLGVGVPS